MAAVIPVDQPVGRPKWIQGAIETVVHTGAAVGDQQRPALADFFVVQRPHGRLR